MVKTKTNFPVGDFLIKIKNSAMAGNKKVTYTANKQIVALAESLKKAGYLDEIKKENMILTLSLAFKDKKPLLMDLKLISKPGRRIYMEVDEIEAKRGPSQYIISTSKGIVVSRQAIKDRMGGEVIAEIW